MNRDARRLHYFMPALVLVVLLPIAFILLKTRPTNSVVLYCSQDEDYALELLREIERDGRLSIRTKFDTEANKSVGLVAELIAEAQHPRADLHWNNEPLGSLRLERRGVYEAGSLVQFAERARVLIVNTTLVPEAEWPTSIFDMTRPRWKGRTAIAKPIFGTTASHAACLFEVLGDSAAQQFFRDLVGNGVTVVAGNKQVARGVAGGDFAFGLTDSDDAALEVLAGKPVAIVFPDDASNAAFPRLGCLFLPNTIAVVKDGPNAGRAASVKAAIVAMEAELARGGGYQFPRTAGVAGPTLPCLQPYRTVRRMQPDFDRAVDHWEAVFAFLRELLTR